eukprot:TRINITY_DN5557_c0_g1_i1.p1 TRINITY_DN5557_c0_g1~~TRINITY_DN5557_c0_g1_i1.p1  ORF type:complete len:567 (+),score=214.77 TRINITY_DN5557_c0_g1_i1:42-1703(+)
MSAEDPFNDPRFAKAKSDPKFRQPRKKVAKEVDDRFTGVMEKSKLFAKQDKDKYGRKSRFSANAAATKTPLGQRRFDSTSKKSQYRKPPPPTVEESGSESDMEEDIEELIKELKDVVDEEDDVETVEEGGASSRLAVMNMDWTFISAEDVLAVLQGFMPAGGVIQKVTVYPSDLGLQKMAEEEEHGPQEIWKDEEDEEGQGTALDEDKLRAHERQRLKYYYAVVECDSAKTASSIYENCDGMEFFNTFNTFDLRFVPDDTVFKNPPRDSATNVSSDYTPPDFTSRIVGNTNIEFTWDKTQHNRQMILNPDKFSRDQLKDMTYQNYLAIEDDDDEGDEKEKKKKQLAARKKYSALLSDLAEEEEKDKKHDDLKITFDSGFGPGSIKTDKKSTISAATDFDSEDSEEEEEEDTISSKAQKKFYNKSDDGDNDDDGDVIDKEISFIPGLSDVAEKALKQKSVDELGSWDKYLTKRTEKKKEARQTKKGIKKSALEAQQESLEALKASKNKKGKKEETDDEKRKREQLELLLADGDEKSGYNLKQMVKEAINFHAIN